VLLGFVLGLTVILCQARIAYVGYRLTELQMEMTQVRAENQAIDGALQRLVAPERIEAVAVQKLGMIKPAAGAELKLPAPIPAVKTENAAGAECEGVTGRKEVSWLKTFLDVLSFKHSNAANGWG
jgi:cell division protein FtsL